MASRATRSPVVQFGHWPTGGKLRSLGPHRNAGLEVVLIARGRLEWQVEGRAEAVGPGSVFFTLPWETHGGVRPSEPGCELYYAVLRLDRPCRRAARAFGFHPLLGLSPGASARLRRALLAAPRRCWPATPRLAAVLPELVAELGRRDASPDAATALARLVLVELSRSLAAPAAGGDRPPALDRVQHFIDVLPARCHQPWPLASMAAACRLGRTRFADLLKQATGDTPRGALNRARVRRAQRLLRETDWPVTRVAAECGFVSSQHFAGVFRAYTGTTARAFRAAPAGGDTSTPAAATAGPRRI